MNNQSILLACALASAAWASPASAATARFDTADAKSGPMASLLDSVRRAAKGAEVPAVGAVKIAPVFWGRDGRWCPDGQIYHGGPCDNSWGGGYPPPPPPYPHPYPPGGEGVDAAMAVCRDMFADSDAIACLRTVRSARYFEPRALRVCRGMFADIDKLACLRTIADAYMEPGAVRVCAGMFSDADKLRCLREQAGRRPPLPRDRSGRY